MSDAWIAAPRSERVSHALLRFGDLLIAVAQGEVRTIEAIEDVDAVSQPPGGIGWIAAFGRSCAVYALSEALAPLHSAPASRRLCVVLGHGDAMFGLACDELRIVDDHAAAFLALPDCMRVADCPLSAAAPHASGIMYLSTVAALARVARAASVGAGPTVPGG